MKGKKILVLLVVLFMCILIAILTGAVAILLAGQYSQTTRISQLENELLSNTNTTTNATTDNSTDTVVEQEAEWSVVSKNDSEETADYKVSIVYPMLSNADHVNVANHVNNYIKSSINIFRDEITGMSLDGSLAKPYVTLDYEVEFLSNNFVSIVISGSQYLGGAHPGSVFSTINYDLLNDTELTLTDIFNPGSSYLSTLSTQTKSELVTLLGVEASDSQLVAGTSADIDNFELFYFTGTDSLENLGIIFGEYQVAPYAAGPQTVELNVGLFDSMFNSEFSSLF